MTENTNVDIAEQSAMSKLLQESKNPPELSELVEGPVIGFGPQKIYIDLHPFGTGIIFGREFLRASDILRKVNSGDMIAAKVVEVENKEGYIELSLQEARQALTWSEAEHAVVAKTVFEVPVKEANRGGLILEWQGIQGFLPASQLKSDHYPRVEDADKDKIFEELKKLIGQKLSVVVITADAKEGKLIFSERGPVEKDKVEMVQRYSVGDIVEGTISGAVDFGLFMEIEQGLEGLVHISEIDWGLVEDPKAIYPVGTNLPAKIIEIKDGKISLSIKALKPNPWKEAKEEFKKGDEVSGVVIKYNKHGALASIKEGVAGLVHISEFEDKEELQGTLELGKMYPFSITLFEPDEQRMTLSFKKKEEK